MPSEAYETRKSLTQEELHSQLILKDLQLRSLFNITQAINKNVSVDELYNMYKNFISWEMNVQKMALYMYQEGKWVCKSTLNYNAVLAQEHLEKYTEHKRLYVIQDSDEEINDFELFIPVFHKEQAISVALIGDLEDDGDIHAKIQFIRAITNIVSVAIENKRLFNIQLEQERYNRDMELASQVQSWLLPQDLPNNSSCTSDFIYMPHNNIGGDYFDYIPVNDDGFFVCIADISGKGTAAALLMANLQAMLKAMIKQYSTIDSLIHDLNVEIMNITNSDKFLTLFIAYINTDSKRLHYVNAGHNPPIHISGSRIEELREGCTVLGAVEELDKISVGKVEYSAGDTLLLYTDGLTDIVNENGEYYNLDTLSTFAKNHSDLPISNFMEKLENEINVFKKSKPFPDDIAVLGLEFH